jgi:hypothetical protein
MLIRRQLSDYDDRFGHYLQGAVMKLIVEVVVEVEPIVGGDEVNERDILYGVKERN